MIEPVASLSVHVLDRSYIPEARRHAARLGEACGMDAAEISNFAIIVTELGTNLVKHAGGGELVIRQLRRPGRSGMEVLSLDKGPGILNLERSLEDGYSTAGSPGNGLGAVIRLATLFDVYTAPGQGTAFLARLYSKRQNSTLPRRIAYEIGAVSLPIQTEKVCGDTWAVEEPNDYPVFLLVDGLGHGPGAAAAAVAATDIFREKSQESPAPLIEAIHNGIRHTRGAALVVVDAQPSEAAITFAGVGNISAAVITGSHIRRMVSHNGTVGHEIRKVQEFAYPWPANALLIMHSDGLMTNWDLEKYPGLRTSHPGLIAGVLYRDFARGRDDVTVVVARNIGGSL